MKDKKNNLDLLKEFIETNVNKIHLEEKLKSVNEELTQLNEEEEQQYQKNTYEKYESDLQDVAKRLSEAAQILENSIIQQESHLKRLPEVGERVQQGSEAKKILVDVFKEVKQAQLNAARKIYK